MKYAFYFLFLFYSIFSSTPIFARTITSFNDSESLMTIAQVMADNAEDMPVSVRISDNKIIIKDTELCTEVSSIEVIKEVRASIGTLFTLYPDEELPVDEAMFDLKNYLAEGPFKKCLVVQNIKHIKKVTTYFFDQRNKIQVKVDIITPITH